MRKTVISKNKNCINLKIFKVPNKGKKGNKRLPFTEVKGTKNLSIHVLLIEITVPSSREGN